MENVLTVPEQEMKPMPSAPYPGHVKLELEGMIKWYTYELFLYSLVKCQ